MNTKKALPVWIMPPFLLCKDNTFFSEMQIPILRSTRGGGASKAKNCDKLGWGKEMKRWGDGGGVLMFLIRKVCRSKTESVTLSLRTEN